MQKAALVTSTTREPDQLRGAWLWLARSTWVLLVVAILLPTILSIPGYYRELVSSPVEYTFAGGFGDYREWNPAELRSAANQLGLSLPFVAAFAIFFSVLNLIVFLSASLLIFWLKSDTWLGLLAAFILAALGPGLAGLPGTLSGVPVLDQLFPIGGAVWPIFFIFLLIYPNGRFQPGWTRLLGFLMILSFGVASFVSETVLAAIQILFVLLIVLCLILPVYRYARLASPLERLQMRWFAFAVLAFLFYWVPGFPPINLYERLFPQLAVNGASRLLFEILFGQALRLLVNALLPISLAVAIFKYRLWNIDLIIRRTLIYAILSASLGLVFFGGVALLQGVFTALTGQGSPAAVVLSTLLIAALFNPLRRRVQEFIDRRFYRSKYDAGKTLAAFAETARSQVDLPALSQALARAADESLKPQVISLWLRPQPLSRREEN